LISADCNVTFSEVIDVCREKSDHNATKISLQIPNYLQKTYQRTIWMYKNADFEKFNKLIRQFNWEESFFTLVNDNILKIKNIYYITQGIIIFYQ
jgi:hypothetical protein